VCAQTFEEMVRDLNGDTARGPRRAGFNGGSVGRELDAFLRDTNPWWSGRPGRPLPPFRRWLFPHALQRLKSGLAPVTVIRGPRQVGKTTLQEQLISCLLREEGVEPNRVFRVQFDEIPSLRGLREPVLQLCRWFEAQILGRTFNEAATAGKPAFLFFDEVQNLDDWAPQVKALVDHHAVRVLLTGSSALRIELGRDSLAGRITTLELGTLLLREIALLRKWGEIPSLVADNGWGALATADFWRALRDLGWRYREVRNAAFAAFSERGGYPVAHAAADRPWAEVAEHLNETVIRRVILHDLRLGQRGRKRDRHLLEELFRLCCRHAGQAPRMALLAQELRAALSADVGAQRIASYLRFLHDTLLLRLIPPMELRLKRRKGQPKICLCDHALRAAWLHEEIPLDPSELEKAPHLADLAGHLAESVAGYFLGTLPGLTVDWFPERGLEPEVDFVLTIGSCRVPVEIKYRQHIDERRDTLGLRAFLEKSVYNAIFGILVTPTDPPPVSDPRIVALPLSSLLLIR